MRGSFVAVVMALMLSSAAAFGQTAAEQTQAFEQAYGNSFYTFDACGDGVAGRVYRRALSERFAHCPLPDAARARFRERTALQRRQSSRRIAAMIEGHDGVPMRLDGMERTCREQRSDSSYIAFRQRLSLYEAGEAGADSVVPEACTAGSFSPY